MLKIKTLFFYVLLIVSAILNLSNANGIVKPEIIKWVAQPGGEVRVNGSTNINNFECNVIGYSSSDTLIFYKNIPNSVTTSMTGSVSLNIANFDCHNGMMTSNLRKTLKMKEYPRMNIRFLSMSKFPELEKGIDDAVGIVDIELAGVTKRFNVECKFSIDVYRIISLQGIKTVKFSDFNLTPPRKLGGMIQAKDDLDVVFKLNLRRVS
jgi:hypothetical protein